MMICQDFEHFSDHEIIARIVAGESRLYELLIRRNNPYLYRIGRSYRYSHEDTEDLMQETYIDGFYALPKFEGKASFKTWLTRIMLNKCYQKKEKLSFQKEQTMSQLPNDTSAPIFHQHQNAEKTILDQELGRVVENALNNIPEEYRLVFTLRELNGLSVSETSEVISITESNVKVRLNRAKNMLRNEIEKMYTPNDIYEFNLVYCDRMVNRVLSAINIPDSAQR